MYRKKRDLFSVYTEECEVSGGQFLDNLNLMKREDGNGLVNYGKFQ